MQMGMDEHATAILLGELPARAVGCYFWRRQAVLVPWSGGIGVRFSKVEDIVVLPLEASDERLRTALQSALASSMLYEWYPSEETLQRSRAFAKSDLRSTVGVRTFARLRSERVCEVIVEEAKKLVWLSVLTPTPVRWAMNSAHEERFAPGESERTAAGFIRCFRVAASIAAE